LDFWVVLRFQSRSAIKNALNKNKKRNFLPLVPAERYVFGHSQIEHTVPLERANPPKLNFYKHTVPLERVVKSCQKTTF
jgi:hypothetical protein